MNALKRWVKESREQQRRAPERYLASYPELVMDETTVMMTRETLERLERNCGRYEGTWPTGEYLGKMWLRGNHLWWFGICKAKPMTHISWNSRKIVVVSENE